jgi:hypothetical protein
MLAADGGPLWAIESPQFREVILKTPAQAGKTVIAQGALSYWLATDPGPSMWVLPAKDEGQTFLESRLLHVFRACAGVRSLLPSGRYAQKATEIQFPYGLFLAVGANSGSKLSGKPVRYLIADEEKDYPAGSIEKAMKRARSYGKTCRILRVSTPDAPGENIDAAHKTGSQTVWRVACPKCGDRSPVDWSRVVVDEDKPTFDERLLSMQISCKECGHAWHDTPEDRAALCRDGDWQSLNDKSPGHIYSATWSALCIPWATWRDVLMEWEKARAAFARGIPQPMRVFYTETLGEAWTPDAMQADDPLPIGHFAKGDDWPEEVERYLAADVQRDRLEVVARRVSATGESRLLYEGTVATLDDLKALQEALDIKPHLCAVDCRYRRPEVLAACHRWGWTAMQGEDRDNGYTWIDKATGAKSRRPFSRVQRIDTGIGTDQRGLFCAMYAWSNRQVKDILALLSQGKGSPWLVAGDASQEYREQMRSEVLREVADRETGAIKQKWVKRHRDRDNHRWDCECMILVLMMATKMLRPADLPEGTLPGAEDAA